MVIRAAAPTTTRQTTRHRVQRRRRGCVEQLVLVGVATDGAAKVAAGEALLSFAHLERQARYDLADVAATAKKDGAGYVLNGEKSLATHGDCADRLNAR